MLFYFESAHIVNDEGNAQMKFDMGHKIGNHSVLKPDNYVGEIYQVPNCSGEKTKIKQINFCAQILQQIEIQNRI